MLTYLQDYKINHTLSATNVTLPLKSNTHHLISKYVSYFNLMLIILLFIIFLIWSIKRHMRRFARTLNELKAMKVKNGVLKANKT